jgi:outer membrane protein TolC
MTFTFVTPRCIRAGLMLLLLGFCSAVRPLFAAESLPTPLPEDLFPALKDILRGALAQSPSMILRNIDLASNEGNYLMSRGQMLPNVSTGAAYNVSGAAVSSNTNVSSTSSGLYYSLSISQPVFRWGTLKAQLDASKIQRNIGQKNYAEAYRTLALSLRTQYLGLMAKKLSLRNTRYAQQQTAAGLVLEEDKLSHGETTENQVVRYRLQAEEASLQAERIAEDFAQSKRYFQRQAGLAELSDDLIPTEIPAVSFEPATASAMLNRFLGHDWEDTLTIQMSRSWLRVSELNYKQAQYRLYPMVGIGASISQSNSTNASLNSVSQVSVLSEYVGVSLSWSIFDGFATRGAKISALANRRYYERQLQTVTDQLFDQAVSLERQVGFAYRAMKLARARTDLSESALRAIQDDAQRGLASRTAVEAAVGSHYQSEYTLLTQRADFLSRWSEFVSTLGHDPILQLLPANYLSHAR